MTPAPRRPTRRRRLRNYALVAAALGLMSLANGPVVTKVAETAYTDFEQSRPAYLKAHGSWDTVELPQGFRTRAVHAAMLYTGDVLLVAGSGNSQQNFNQGKLQTVLWNPVTGHAKHIKTPEDLFCGGHAYLPNGNLLVAGGTKKYEVLHNKVTAAAGTLTVKNESPDHSVTLPKGTHFTGPGGRGYTSTEKVVVPAAHQMADYSVMASAADVWIRADGKSKDYVTTGGKRFTVSNRSAAQSRNLYGTADAITFKKQDYRGLDASYIYNVRKEKYVKTARLTSPRWYPTLVSMNGGNVLAVSGLDDHGQISNGRNEVFNRHEKTWHRRPDLHRYFPTYPQLFRLRGGRLFYSGANTGYGSATAGRKPGIWDLHDNSFQPVPGLRHAGMNETATSFLLPPAQKQKVAIAGGGAIGDNRGSTNRMDIADLSKKRPKYQPGTDLPHAARYVSAVTLPDDTVLLTGGSSDYRGRHASDLHSSQIYHPAAKKLTMAAPNQIGRDYHSTALLLPDGRVMTMGSDPLYGDAKDTKPGHFETRIEIYTPPYLETGGKRPVIDHAPSTVHRGTEFAVHATSAHRIVKARLLRPSAVTHQTDTEQRSVALDVTKHCPTGKRAADCCSGGCDLTLSLGKSEGLTPSGPYMLVLVDDHGVPSKAAWVQVR